MTNSSPGSPIFNKPSGVINSGLSSPSIVKFSVLSEICPALLALMQNVKLVKRATSAVAPIILLPSNLRPAGKLPDIKLNVTPGSEVTGRINSRGILSL